MLKKAWNFLSSMRFAVILLLVLIAACAAGSFVTQGQTLAWYTQTYSERTAALIMALHLDDVFHSLWFIVYFFFAVAPSFLISGPRYLAAAVPIYPALAELGKRRGLSITTALLCAAGELAYLWAFLQSWNVY